MRAMSDPREDARLRSLVAAVAKGDEDALGDLYDATVGRTNAIALRITRRREDAEEVVCDVYLQIWRQAARFDPERGSVLAWLASIARSRALDLLRRREPSTLRGAPVDEEHVAIELGADPESLVSAVQEGSALHAALRGLSEAQQKLLGLAYFRGLSHAEIAAEAGLPLGTVKTHIRRGLQALARALPDPDAEGS